VIRGIVDPSVLEALAWREALALAQDLDLHRVTVATDCIAVVNDMNRPYAGRYSSVPHEIKDQLPTCAEISFRHDSRASNSEAHRVTRSPLVVLDVRFGCYSLLMVFVVDLCGTMHTLSGHRLRVI
jgi:hypothetical protein